MLIIGVCHARQELNWSIIACSFNSNTAVYLIYIFETLKLNSGFVTISNTVFQENTLVNNLKQYLDSALIFLYSGTFQKVNNYPVHHLLNNNTIKNNLDRLLLDIDAIFNLKLITQRFPRTLQTTVLYHSQTPQIYTQICVMNTIIVNNSIPQFHEHYAVVYITGGICQIKNVTFQKNRATPLALVSTSAYFMATIMFHDNIALYGGGIYFDSNTYVTYSKNS